LLFLTRYAAEFFQGVATRVGHRTLRSQSLRLLLKKAAYVTVWVVGVLLACVVLFPGLGLGDIIATLGLGSVAIGFAFQDIFKNFLAGVILLVEDPFSLGDQVIIEGYEGTVESINIRTTTIRTYQGERIVLPNATVFTNAVQVRTAFDYRRTDLGVGVDYNTPLPKARDILQRTVSQIEGVLENPAPEMDLVNFGDSSIDFIVRYWTVPQQQDVRRVQTQVVIAIKQAFDQADISIPYPIRTLYYYDQEKYNDYIPTSNHQDSQSVSNSGLLEKPFS
ncbi:MAG: mechanosensitive ion channel family protein, partial [Cyanobacteriota bacterium]